MKKSIMIIVAGLISSVCYSQTDPNKLSTEAHRGGRGVMPENTIQAMKYAIDLKDINTLEMDICITKDKQPIVSHDVYFHWNITTTPQGNFLSKEEARKYLLYQMTYDSTRKYDVGLKPHPDFPQQKRFAAVKPLLTDLITETEQYSKKKGKTMYYNMEIKSRKAGDGIEHPAPEEFVDLVINMLKQKKILSRTIIQSFDIRPLQVIHKKYPEVRLSLLVGKNSAPVDQVLAKLGFFPNTYSPESSIVTPEMIAICHDKNIKVLPWTVNTLPEIKTLVAMGVDGIITDYPELLTGVYQEKLNNSKLKN